MRIDYDPPERRRLRNELEPYITILEVLVVIFIIATGIATIFRLDAIMSAQALHDKTLSDAMDQIMWLRMDLDKLKEVDEPDPPEQISLGEYTITHYCACSKCCGEWANGITATGTVATQGRTIAVDPEIIPYGTKVMIDGHEYVAEDTGGAIRGNKIDIYVADHQEALSRGRITREVRLAE